MACNECAKLGRIIWEEETKHGQDNRKATVGFVPRRTQKKPSEAQLDPNQELVEDYGSKIRKVRENQGLSQKELGKKIKEKASVVRKIEAGKATPSNTLITKLEHVLKIKLLVSVSEEKPQQTMIPTPKSPSMTFGDLLQLKEKKAEEEPVERGQS